MTGNIYSLHDLNLSSDFEKNDDSLLGNFCVEIIRLIAAYLLNGAKIVSRSKKYDAFFCVKYHCNRGITVLAVNCIS